MNRKDADQRVHARWRSRPGEQLHRWPSPRPPPSGRFEVEAGPGLAVSRPLPGGTMRRVVGQVRPEN